MRPTSASGSVNVSRSSRRTFTCTPVDEIAPSHFARRSTVNAFERVSTTSALIAEPLQLGRDPDLGPVVERTGNHDVGCDPHAQPLLEPRLDRVRDRLELRGIPL